MYGCMDVWMYGCMDVWDRSVTDARNAELGQVVVGRHPIHDHRVDRHRDALTDATDQGVFFQAGNEEAGRTRGCVRLRPLESFANRLSLIPALARGTDPCER